MNVPLLVAGSLSFVAAAIHGLAGEVLVVKRLSPGALPSSPFGGPVMTKLMIRATWHLTTVGFLTVGAALVLAGSVLRGEVANAVGLVGAGAATGFAAVVLIGAAMGGRRTRVRHLAPFVLPAIAVLAWWGLAL